MLFFSWITSLLLCSYSTPRIKRLSAILGALSSSIIMIFSTGLSVELYTEVDEYIASMGIESGLRVVIHDKDKVPLPDEEGFTVSAGFTTNIGVRKVSVSPRAFGKKPTLFLALTKKKRYLLKLPYF